MKTGELFLQGLNHCLEDLEVMRNAAMQLSWNYFEEQDNPEGYRTWLAKVNGTRGGQWTLAMQLALGLESHTHALVDNMTALEERADGSTVYQAAGGTFLLSIDEAGNRRLTRLDVE